MAPAFKLLLLTCVVTTFITPHAIAADSASVDSATTTNNPTDHTTDIDSLYAAASELSRLHSVAVYNEDGLQLSLHVRGTPPYEPANIKSVSKSVLSLLTGIGVERGYLESLQQPITDVLGSHLPDNHNPELENITIEHLLSMQSGLQRTSGRNYGAWVASNNWVHNALNRRFVDAPGGSMLYSTGNSHILAAILTEQTGLSLHTLAQQWLGRPLGIDILPWTRSPEGVYMGGNEMHLSAQSLAELGQVYFRTRQTGRNVGSLNGTPLITKQWITESFSARTHSVFTDHPHGLGWFQYCFTNDQGKQIQSWYGRGYGGQVWYIFPQNQLSIVVLSDPTPPSRGSYLTTIHRFVEREILPFYL